MKIIVFVTFLIISNSVFSKGSECFSTHIKDAISKNKKRKKLYSELTDGKSESISNLLINSERIVYFIAKFYDSRVRKYQKEDIPILCLDYVDMNLAPKFSSSLSVPPLRYEEVPVLKIKKMKNKLKESLKKGFDDLSSVTEEILSESQNSGHYNCMVIHVLESIRRSSILAPHYISASLDKGLSSPKKLLERNIKNQINTLGIWYHLDKKAAPVQESGLKIICQDIPKINIPTNYEIDSISN